MDQHSLGTKLSDQTCKEIMSATRLPEFSVFSNNDDEAVMILVLTDHSVTIVSKLNSLRSNSLFTD